MSDQSYQGWANYPTWAVALWIDNDEWYQREVLELVEDSGPYAEAYEYTTLEHELAERLKNWVAENRDDWLDELHPSSRTNMHTDLLNWAIEMVDWHELATHYLKQAREDES